MNNFSTQPGTLRTKIIGMVLVILCAVFTLGISVYTFAAQPTNQLTYQGRLLNSNGVPVSTSSANMQFRLYDADTGGTCLWSNDDAGCANNANKSISLTDGLFTVNLGNNADGFALIPDSVFADNADVYLEVEVEGEVLTPRKRMTAAPYAMNAQTLDGMDSGDFLASTGDTATGDYDFTGANLDGQSPLVFDGSTDGGNTTTFNITNPSANRTITFQDGTGTVAFTSDITGGGSSLWEDGTNGVYEDDEGVIVGIDQAETLSNTNYTLASGDLFIQDELGVEGEIYTDSGLTIGATTTFDDGAIDSSGTLSINTTNNQETEFGGNVIPVTDDDYNLGSSLKRWQDLYLGPASLHVGTDGNEGVLSYDTANSNFNFDSDFVPTGDGTLDIGSDANRANSLYVDGYTGSTPDEGIFVGPNSDNMGGILYSVDNDAFIVGAGAPISTNSTASVSLFSASPSPAALVFQTTAGGMFAQIEGDISLGSNSGDIILNAATSLASGRFEASAHSGNQGFKLPTVSGVSGVPSSVTGQEEGDVVWNDDDNALYVYDNDLSSFVGVSGGGGSGSTDLDGAYDNDSDKILDIDNGALVFDPAFGETFEIADSDGLTGVEFDSGANATFNRTSNFNGKTNVNSNIDLGDGTGDTITFNGRVDSNLLPFTDNTYDLGAQFEQWNDFYYGGRLESPSHGDNAGLRLPTTVDGVGNVAGQKEGDIVWDNSGNNNNLYVYDADSSSYLQVNDSGSEDLDSVYTNDADKTLSVGSGDLNFDLTGTDDFVIQDAGNTFATFANNGRLGLGTTSPDEALHVANGNAKVTGSGYDLSTAEYSGDVFDVDSENLTPTDIDFNDDGTKMYMLGTYSSVPAVYEYDLGTPWDQSTATYNGNNADITGEFANARGLAFGDSGNKMYVSGTDSDTVVEYDLSTPWDVTTASATNTLNVGTETDYPYDISFQDDGSRMFIVDLDFGGTDRVLEYDLSSNWSISSASYNTGEDFAYTASSNGTTMTFNATGSKMYIAGDGNGAENFVHEFNLSTPWDVSSASFNNELYVNHLDEPQGIAFKPDGSKLFGIGAFDFPDSGNRLVHSYDLTTPFDITTADHSSIDYRVTAQATNPTVVVFGDSGSKMYVFDNNTTTIYAYDLATPWVPETATYNGESFDPSGEETNVDGFHFKSDGTKFYLTGSGDIIYEYDLNIAWDISTIVTPPANSVDLDALTGGAVQNPSSIEFKPDGSKFYVMNTNLGDVAAFDLGTNWDIGSVSVAETYSSFGFHVVLSTDGSRMYIGDIVNDGEVEEYILSTKWDVSSASPTGEILALGDFDRSIPLGLAIQPNGSRLFVIGNNEDTVNVFEMDSVGGNIDVAGNTTIGGLIQVDGSATMNDTLSVSGLATFNDVDFTGTLTSPTFSGGSSELILPTNAGTPSGSTTEGSIVWDSSGDALNVFDGSSFVQLATSSSASDDLDSVYANDADKTLTLNDANGSLTFASTETDNDVVVDLQSTGDFVIQDSGTPAFTLADNGTATFTNLLSAVGGVDLGDQSSDLISFNGQFDTNLIPNADGTVDFGSDGNRINNMYVDSFDGSTESPQGLWFGPDADNQANLSYDSNTNTFSILSGVGTSTNPASLELNTQNTGADAIQLSTSGGIDLSSGRAGSDAIDINATGTGGGIDMDTTDGPININTGSGNTGNFISLNSADNIDLFGKVITIESNSSIDLEGSPVQIDLDTTTHTAAICHTGGTGTFNPQDVVIEDCSGTPSADYMEMYPAASDVTTGDLVEIGTTDVTTEDGDTIKQITKSTGAYSGKIIGIASNPSDAGDFNSIGYNIADTDNPYPVALNGRVKLNVNDQNGAIAPGDPITSSTTAGVGMKATQPGMVVGYALEAHTSGTGQIMVFVDPGYHSGTTIANDGTMPTFDSDFAYTKTAQATSTDEGKASHTLMFRGSGWDGSQAKDVAMQVNTQVTDASEYRLSIKDATDSEVAYISNNGKMEIAGDMVVGGKLYPSDRGTPQTDKYIYYDGSSGGAGDMMRTNAGGWSTGSYDFAEMFPSTQELEPGDVVTFAKDEEHVRRTDTANTQTIAGVVSTQPGFLAGENKEGHHPIALAGRVPTKVTLEGGGKIEVGDPLTSSAQSGVAMRANQPGMVLGYALEPYDGTSEDDTIIVFINASYYDGQGKSPQLAGTDNSASQLSFSDNGSSLTSLDMAGNIYMHGNEIRSVGRLVGISDRWSVEEDGTFKTEGSYKVVVESYQGEDVEADSLLTRGQRVFLSGVTKLDNGMATVEFEQEDDKFNDITSTQAPVSVVLTPDGPAQLYITEKDNNGFTIEQMDGTDSGITVNWMVTAYRKGQEPERFLENDNDGTTDNPTQDTSDIDEEDGSDDDENPDSSDGQDGNNDDTVEEQSDDVSNDSNGESADDDGSDEQTSDADSGTNDGSSSNDEADSGSITDDGVTNDDTTDGDGTSEGDASNDEDDSANSTDTGVDDDDDSSNDDTNTQTDSGSEDAPDVGGEDSGSTEDSNTTGDTDTDTSTNETDESAMHDAGDGSTDTATEDGQTSGSTDDPTNDQGSTDGSNDDTTTDDSESTDDGSNT